MPSNFLEQNKALQFYKLSISIYLSCNFKTFKSSIEKCFILKPRNSNYYSEILIVVNNYVPTTFVFVSVLLHLFCNEKNKLFQIGNWQLKIYVDWFLRKICQFYADFRQQNICVLRHIH